jgi:hypothetical protein
MSLDGSQQIGCPAIVQEVDALAEAPKGSCAELVAARRVPGNVVRQTCTHVMEFNVREQVGSTLPRPAVCNQTQSLCVQELRYGAVFQRLILAAFSLLTVVSPLSGQILSVYPATTGEQFRLGAGNTVASRLLQFLGSFL